jgi:hypothetical protein
MHRRNFVIAAPATMAVAVSSTAGRTLPFFGRALSSRQAAYAAHMGATGIVRHFGTRLPMQAAVSAGLVPAGTFLLVSPTTARADGGFTLMAGFAIVAIVRAVLKRNSERDEQLMLAENWEPASQRSGDLHQRTTANDILKPQARFHEVRNGVQADLRDGTPRLVGPANAGLAQNDLNALEALALADSSTVFPVTPRYEPTGDARRRMEEAFKLMGGTFGGKDGAYARVFSDAAGSQVAGVTNGTFNGREALVVAPPQQRSR